MKVMMYYMGLLVLFAALPACSYDNKPDAVVVDNDQLTQNETLAADTGSYAQVETTPAAARETHPTVAADRKPARTKAAAMKALRRDARLARTMSLQRFGQYMTRRWDYYRGFGEVSYDDDRVEIKITNEELKIETPEGKYKREKDEMKLKTDTRKIKREVRS